MKQPRAGFTLIELMIALAVLSFGILGVAIMQSKAMSQGNASRFSFGASQVAKSQMAQIQRLPWSALPQTGGNGDSFEALCPTTWAGGTCNSPGTGLPAGTSGFPYATPDTLPTVLFQEEFADGTVVEPIRYSVAWRVKDVALGAGSAAQCQKDVFLRVQWQEGSFATREYYLSTRLFNSLGDRDASAADLGMIPAVGTCG